MRGHFKTPDHPPLLGDVCEFSLRENRWSKTSFLELLINKKTKNKEKIVF